MTPNPGSKDAIAQGCTCPVLDNGYGRGVTQIDGQWTFWISATCPVHRAHNPQEDDDEPDA